MGNSKIIFNGEVLIDLTVVNTGTVPVIVDANTAFAIRRVA